MKDCFGIEYKVVSMPGNGFCGYSCLSYALTGDKCLYAEVVEDLLKVFFKNPQIFVQQTEFGRRTPNLSVYENQMRQAIASVRGHSLSSLFWCEDAHLISFALLYDVTVFVYDSIHRKWYAYGDDAHKGYICLLSSGGHFDVLEGPSGRPPVPRQAEKLCLDAQRLSWHQVDTVNVDRFPYTCVNKWDDDEVEFVDSDSSSSPLRRFSYAEIVRSGSPVSIDSSSVTVTKEISSSNRGVCQETLKSQEISSVSKTAHSFQCSVCSRTFVSKRNLHIHCSKMHKKRAETVFEGLSNKKMQAAGDASLVTSAKPDTRTTSTGTFACAACSRSFLTKKGLHMHERQKHKVTSVADLNVKHTGADNTERFVSCETHQCNECSRVFNSKRSLRIHLTKIHKELGDTAFEDMVNKGMQDTAVVTSDKFVASKEAAGKFVCAACAKVFPTKQALRMHQFRKHQVSSLADVRNLKAGITESSAHCDTATRCSMCNKSFNDLHALKHHQHNKHKTVDGSRKKAVSNTKQKPVKMRMVKAQEVKPTSLASNGTSSQDVPSNSYSCCFCNKLFNSQSGLRMHMTKMHKGHSASTIQHNAQSNQETKDNTTRTRKSANKQTVPLAHSTVESMNREVNQRNASLEITQLYKNYPPLKQNMIVDDNEMHLKLKTYHDQLLGKLSNVSTEKVTDEIREVIADLTQMKDEKRKFTWSKNDENRLNLLNTACKALPVPSSWFWAADDKSQQGIFNEKRMEFCIQKELETKIIHCPECESTGVLVGLDQINSAICVDCLDLKYMNNQTRKSHIDAWAKVKPASQNYPTRAESGHESEELPILTVGERAVIAAVHPVVTVTKNFVANKKYKQESISLLQNSQATWAKILPRTDLQNRFIVVERTFKDANKKYIICNPHKVSQWLNYLFKNHKDYMRLNLHKQLELSEQALSALERQSELASVVTDEDDSAGNLTEEDGIVQAAMESGLSKNEVYTFDKYPNLYLNSRQVIKIKQKGLIEVVEDDSNRRPTYTASANVCFPHLYPNGEMAPLDFGDYKLGKDLLKKQTLFAHKMADGNLRWNYAEDSIHMMHQFARLTEQTVHAKVGYYINQHPDKAHSPLQSILQAFKDGMNEDGLIDSQLPDLSAVMSRIPNSRQKWFAERLGIEAISRDLGDPNVFITLNMDPRAWPDVRQLIYRLEYGLDCEMDKNWFELNTEKYTELLDKYAPQVAIYLCRKAKIFLRAFLCGICRIPPAEVGKDEHLDSDWTLNDRYKNGFFFSRVEYTSTRGCQHWHCLAKLPNVLDTALLGRIIHNGRVVRQELKCGNICPDKTEDAWTMVEMGLLASRYATLFADSISQASFYAEDIGNDHHNSDKVIDVEQLRQEFVDNYKNKNVSVDTHPIMRSFNDSACDSNQNVENAKVAAVSCMHHCIENICGGDEKGSGCRFSFPKKPLRCTVPAVMQVNAEQMEAQVLLKRTCDRVPNLNRYFLKYWRANHDVTTLVDASHSMRYALKYVSKSRKQNELMEEIIDYLSKRSNDLVPPNMKQALSHLILADCSHRESISKQELSYKVMNLPEIRKSFADVSVVGFYPRANITQSVGDSDVIEYSDRTEYSAYAERCRPDTICNGFDKAELENMCFREFAETVGYRWNTKKLESESLSPTSPRKFKTRDINSGHWVLHKLRSRRHIRWSTVLYCEPAHLYEEVELGSTTSQTLYFDLPLTKRRQLYRAYQEMVCYRPWQVSPEETFLSVEIRKQLSEMDPESESRYSLMKLEAFQRKYRSLWEAGEVAPEGSQWHRDNQYCYTMHLTSLHNADIRLDRSANKGVFSARYEAADELADMAVDVRPPIDVDVDEADVPSVLNFLPPDIFRDFLEQEPPVVSDICVAFPMNHIFQEREEMVSSSKVTWFMADPPPPAIHREDLSFWHSRAIDLVVGGHEQIIYVYGKAGTGKTEVALHICEHFKGRVQAGSGTGKAASNFNGPTTHAMFGWSQTEYSRAVVGANKAAKWEKLRVFYENVDVFVIDEVNAMSAAELGFLDETMHSIFDPDGNVRDENGFVKPFGGKTMVFLGDAAQLRPVCGAAIFDKGFGKCGGRKSFHSSQYKTRTLRGQALYTEYMSKSCIWLERGFRNRGLLQEIFDRVRNGEQTLDDLEKIAYQCRQYPDTQTDYGIHYSNESCSVSNWLDLWKTCTQQQPHKRLYISKAGYHTTGDNDLVISTLASIPASQYNFAPDVLCVSEGCEIRLITNLNVSAGLVNSASGTVVKVIYNNADVQSLLHNENPPAYCIIVNFPQFRGFLVCGERHFPFRNHKWVPLYRQKFLPQSVPSSIRKQQKLAECYREQFPIDLSRHITAHRGQGQTWKNRLLMVNLGLESPNSHIPPDIGSVIYVACTRTNELKNLFVRPIFPSIWEKIGKSEQDIARRECEGQLRKDAEEFAAMHGWQTEFEEEQSFLPDYSGNETEWNDTVNAVAPPAYTDDSVDMADVIADEYDSDEESMPAWLKPYECERHIGVDQGEKHFAMVAVDSVRNSVPKLVGAELYNLQQEGLDSQRWDAMDLVILLQTKTLLLNWMQHPGYQPVLPRVDRVVVHLEQLSIKHKHSKHFAIELGRLLQQLFSVNNCIVKLSSPHIHRASGPMFKLGQNIIEKCSLKSASTARKRQASRPVAQPQVKRRRVARNAVPSDVEPDSSSDSDNTYVANYNEPVAEYRRKKKMSTDIFTYFINATREQQVEMQVDIDENVQLHWRQQMLERSVKKFDDLGDALLHALNEILCGSSNYRPLVPSTPSLHINRSVVLSVRPTKVYWVVIQCTWNVFTIENLGVYESCLPKNQKFADWDTVDLITCNLDPDLRQAVMQLNASDLYSGVDHIKTIVKQLTGCTIDKFSNKAAGALTSSTLEAMTKICDEAAGTDSCLSSRTTKQEGWTYVRTLKTSKQKLQVTRSTGKHTNAMLMFLEWAKQNIPVFVKNRPLHMDEVDKLKFFNALKDLSGLAVGPYRMEMIRLSDHVVQLLRSRRFSYQLTQIRLADLILIGLNKNGQYVSAVAPAYRKDRT